MTTRPTYADVLAYSGETCSAERPIGPINGILGRMAAPQNPTERAELAQALRTEVRGEVDLGATARALTTMDASNYRRVPLGVVAPRDADDVAAALAVCRAHGVPVVPRGGGTSIAGQATGTGIVLDLTRHLRKIVELDPVARTAVVQPGVILDELRTAAAPHGLTFGPDPSTHSRCTLGGMIGNNSCGAHSVAWGTTADNTHALTVTRYGGDTLRLARGTAPEALTGLPGLPGLPELIRANLALLRTRFPELPRRISGYALDALLPERGTDLARAFCGSEGTLGVVTEATVRLVEAPAARALAVLGYADEAAAAEAAPGLLPHHPLTVEGMAADLVREPAGLPRGGAWLFAETGGATPPRRGRTPSASCGRPMPWTAPSSPTPLDNGPCGASARTPRAPRPGCRTAPRPGPAGRTAPYRPPASARTSATSAPCSPNTACAAPRTATSATAASTSASTSTC